MKKQFLLLLGLLLFAGQIHADPPHRRHRGNSGHSHHNTDRHDYRERDRNFKHQNKYNTRNRTDYYGYRGNKRLVHANYRTRYNGSDYRYRKGRFLRYQRGHYVNCIPPIGFRINFIPPQARYYRFRGGDYFVVDDLIFRSGRRGFLYRVRAPRGFWNFCHNHCTNY